MLLTSPGDHTASPPDSLSEQTQAQTNGMLRPGSLEGSQLLLTVSPPKLAPKTIVGDRDEASVPTNPADAASSGDRSPPLPALTQPFHRQRVLRPYRFDERDGLSALRRAAGLRVQRQSQADVQSLALNTLPDVTGYRALGSYAAPLSPLRVRDLTALSALFQRDDMPAIEADVNHRLLSLLPEPCWEDDVFAFLQEFL